MKLTLSESDPVCNHYTCGYDRGDCGQCAPGCTVDKIRNGVCDPECFNPACAFDTDDCFPTGEEEDDETSGSRLLAESSPATKASKAGKSKLPKACKQASKRCKPKWIGDKYCDLIACGRECDAADCQQADTSAECFQTCRPQDLYNDRCDKGCATLACNFDGGLCPVSCDAACGNKITLDKCSKPQCDVPMCRYDIGRCRDNANVAVRCSPACEVSMLGDGQCNPECNNAACKWDGEFPGTLKYSGLD